MTEHRARIFEELRKAGVSSYGKIKLESDYLPNIIHENEHIMAVAYGRTIKEKNPSFTKLMFLADSAMLVATESRVIYLDRKPAYSYSDEITYDVVAGVTYGEQGLFASLTLHTRLGDYVLRYVNEKSAKKFVEYIEKRRLERKNGGEEQKSQPKKSKATKFSQEAEEFLNKHEVAVISTLGRTGAVHGAVVYYYAPGDGRVYFVTKGETNKAHNILYSGQVALTIYDEQNLQTLQLQGQAIIESDPDMKQTVFDQLMRERDYGGQKRRPPITQLHEGAFEVISITPSSVKFTDFKNIL